MTYFLDIPMSQIIAETDRVSEYYHIFVYVLYCMLNIVELSTSSDEAHVGFWRIHFRWLLSTIATAANPVRWSRHSLNSTKAVGSAHGLKRSKFDPTIAQ